MRFKKSVAIADVARLFFWTPTIITANAGPVGCGLTQNWLSFDTAFAARALPCPGPVHGSAFPVFAILTGVVSVMFNAAVVWNTQCRELTHDEAVSSLALPFLGMAFNTQNNQCHK